MPKFISIHSEDNQREISHGSRWNLFADFLRKFNFILNWISDYRRPLLFIHGLAICSFDYRGFDYLWTRKKWKTMNNEGKTQFQLNLGLNWQLWNSWILNSSGTEPPRKAREACNFKFCKFILFAHLRSLGNVLMIFFVRINHSWTSSFIFTFDIFFLVKF